MTTGKQDSDSIMAQIISWLNKYAEAKQSLSVSQVSTEEVQKKLKDANLEQTVEILSQALTQLLSEVTKVAVSLSSTIKAVNEHSVMIEELYTVQSSILKLLKSGSLVTSSETASTKYEAAKKKTDKPN